MNAPIGSLLQLVAEALRLPVTEVGPDMEMAHTDAWDSLSHMELILSIEKRYAIQLTPDEMVELTSVGRITQALQARGLLACN